MIELKNIKKIYSKDGISTEALKDISLSIEKGEMIAIMGRSGSGKTTLLNILGCMDTLTEGEYIFNDEHVEKLSLKQMDMFRKDHISFVFQNFALMNQYTAFENIEMPLLIGKSSKKERRDKVNKVLELVGITELSDKLPTKMSGGQQQRCAIARALVTDSDIILADEPTGALDEKTGTEIMDLFESLNKQGKTVIIVTHDKMVAERCKRIVHIKDGIIE
ncbi:MAG: ABC transporter ATP-binding protein [Lachnospiraceae bacterium]|nr:ABC transporter ATP-binding protein [Lachnospiraceae bacterium]